MEEVVAVTGATGFIGRFLVPRLLDDGRRVRAVVRDALRAASVLPPAAQRVSGDLADEDALTRALSGARTVIHLVGIIRGRSSEFAAVHREGTARLLRAARRSGSVDFFIYVSALGADAASINPYLRTKGEAEALVQESGIPFLILRPALVLGRGDGFTTPLVQVLRQSPVIPIIGSGRYPLRPVAVGDLVTLISRATDGAIRNLIFTVAGPQEVTYADLVRMLSTTMGLRKPLVRLPLFLVSSAVRGLESAVPNPVLSSLQLDLLRRGSTGDPGPAVQAFGLDLTPLGKALEEAVR